MKKMYNTSIKQDKKMVVKADTQKVRNELHFLNCFNSNMAYVSKNKKRIIPRKQKYKNSIDF